MDSMAPPQPEKPPLAAALAAASAAAVPPHVEIQREVDAMQAVYTQERRQLELLACELQEEARSLGQRSRELRAGASAAAAGVVRGSAVAPQPHTRQITWRLEGVPRGGVAATDAPQQCLRQQFRLPEFPGVEFNLTFLPGTADPKPEASRGGSSGQAPPPRPRCRLVFGAAGEAAQGLHLAVFLRVGAGGEEGEAVGEAAASAAPAAPCAEAELRGGGEVVCEGPLPLGPPPGGPPPGGPLPGGSPLGGPRAAGAAADASVLTCCAKLTLLGFEPPPLRLESLWPSLAGPAEESDDDEGDDGVGDGDAPNTAGDERPPSAN